MLCQIHVMVSFLWDTGWGIIKTEREVMAMKTNKNEEFIITDGYLLVMEAIRLREEKKKYMWDVEDDGYFFEERF